MSVLVFHLIGVFTVIAPALMAYKSNKIAELMFIRTDRHFLCWLALSVLPGVNMIAGLMLTQLIFVTLVWDIAESTFKSILLKNASWNRK